MFQFSHLLRKTMTGLLDALRLLLPVLYVGLLVYFARTFLRSNSGNATTERRLRYALPAAYSVLAVHAIYIGVFTSVMHHELLATIYELMSLIAFTLLAVYIFAELRPTKETSGTGFFVAAVAFLLQAVSSVTIGSETTAEIKPLLRDPIFNLHVTTSVFGYAALILAAIYGGLYLLLYHALRRNEYGALFEHIPSLSRLERYGTRATAVGFVFLTLSIALGWMLLERFPPVSTTGNLLLDPKVLTTLLVWLVFGVTLLLRKVVHVEGRKLVLFWMSGFALTVLSMTIVNAVATNFHSFL
jgi:HemX protein